MPAKINTCFFSFPLVYIQVVSSLSNSFVTKQKSLTYQTKYLYQFRCLLLLSNIMLPFHEHCHCYKVSYHNSIRNTVVRYLISFLAPILLNSIFISQYCIYREANTKNELIKVISEIQMMITDFSLAIPLHSIRSSTSSSEKCKSLFFWRKILIIDWKHTKQ